MNALVYVNIDQGIHKVKYKVAQNEKRKKLRWNILLSANLYFWKVWYYYKFSTTNKTTLWFTGQLGMFDIFPTQGYLH